MDSARIRAIVGQICQDDPDEEVCGMIGQMADDLLFCMIQTAAAKAEQRNSQQVELIDLESVAIDWKIDPATSIP